MCSKLAHMPLTPVTKDTIAAFVRSGWRLTRDGSTATAHFAWDDPEDEESGWELLVLHTSGHGARLTLNAYGSGLTERPPADAHRLGEALWQALVLVEGWSGPIILM